MTPKRHIFRLIRSTNLLPLHHPETAPSGFLIACCMWRVGASTEWDAQVHMRDSNVPSVRW